LVETTGEPDRLEVETDRKIIKSDGKDLIFITVKVADDKERVVPRSDNMIEFSIDGPGKIVATDNGDQTDMMPFPLHNRKAFNGLALVIVRSVAGNKGIITVKAKSPGLKDTSVEIKSY
jgi:beta-galactosidase